MKNKIKNFFTGPGAKIINHLGSGATILIIVGQNRYTLKVNEERELKVEEDGAQADVEIRGEEAVMSDLLSSSSIDEFSKKARAYIMEGKEPKGKILMERTLENSRKFQALYYYFLRGMFLIK